MSLNNKLEKLCLGSQTGCECWPESPASLSLTGLSDLTVSSDSPSPPPPTLSDAEDSSSVDKPTGLGASPADAIPEFRSKIRETTEEAYPSCEPCDYGEPMRPQHVVLDFTPVEGLDDNAYNVKKVVDFWNYIRTIPGLESLRASPEEWDKSESSEHITPVESDNNEPEKSGTVNNVKSAIPWMKCNHLVSSAFAATQRGTRCGDGGNGDYFAPEPHKVTKRPGPKPGTSRSSCISKQSTTSSSQASSGARGQVQALCKQLDQWDRTHPRPLDPPAPPPKPGYNYAVLQRNID